VSNNENDLSGVAVLVVDDDGPIRSAYKRLLAEMGVTSVFSAEDGIAAIEILHARGHEIQVILLDLRMPRMDGMEFLRHLVNVHPHPVAVVLATAYGDRDVQEWFYKVGSLLVLPAGYLTKPFEKPQFREAVLHAQSLVKAKRHGMEEASVARVQERLDRVAGLVESLHQKTPTFWTQIGLQVAVALILGAFVIVALYLGIDRIIAKGVP
jgi:CheY-like chemotaxis protein